MKNITQTTLFICLFIFTISCEDDYIETNQVQSSTVEPLPIPEILRKISNLNYNLTISEAGKSWAQQTSKIQYNDTEIYIPRQAAISAVWDVYYKSTLPLIEEMHLIGETENNDNIKGISLILKAYSFSFLTDLFGDIPFSEALSSTTPRYDLQENIYPQLILMLTEAEALFRSRDVIDSDSDVLYQGDIIKWKRFANSLKFRCLMRMSNSTDVSNQLQQLINTKPLFQSNEDEAKYIYPGVTPDANPIHETIVNGNRGEFKINSVTVEMLKANNDPRLSIFAQPNRDGFYIGKPSGGNHYYGVPQQYNYLNVSSIGRLYLRPNTPAYLMSYAELEFLIAEAITKGHITGSAYEHYINGVNSSFEANQIPELARQFLINYPFKPTNALEQIGNQKWLALYLQGFEAWTEQRRTGYPLLTPAANGVIDEIPSRLNYPEQQQTENVVNYNEAVSLQGPDNLTTQLWWQQ